MSKTIAAIATGNSVSGIGVIRISGDCAIEIAQKVFKSADNTPLSSLRFPYRISRIVHEYCA